MDSYYCYCYCYYYNNNDDDDDDGDDFTPLPSFATVERS